MKYFQYIDNTKFVQHVRSVVSEYNYSSGSANKRRRPSSQFIKDTTKDIFDMRLRSCSSPKHVSSELQLYKQHQHRISMKLGEFHQNVIGDLPGCRNLGRGHPTGMDIYVAEKQTYIEVKNKHTTINSASKAGIIDKCKHVLKEIDPKAAQCLICFVHTPKADLYRNIVYKDQCFEQISEISGQKLYHLLTDDEESWDKLHFAISYVLRREAAVASLL